MKGKATFSLVALPVLIASYVAYQPRVALDKTPLSSLLAPATFLQNGIFTVDPAHTFVGFDYFASVLALSLTPHAQTSGSNWPAYNGDLGGRRYSPLKEITKANVGRLKAVARFETGQDASFQTGPVVVDGTMFLTTYKHTYAIDAVTGRLKWKDVADLKKQGIANNRGVAYDDGRVFRGYNNGDFTAFDAATGSRLWTRRIGHSDFGESMPIAPIAWHGHVYVGQCRR